jgi:gluconate kinase
MASAHSQEYRDSSYINKTSFVENGFTSALGRALGYLGIGIDTSIASANEVQNAVKNQDNDNKKWLTDAQFNATLKATKEQAEKVLAGFKMKKEYREQIINKFNI